MGIVSCHETTKNHSTVRAGNYRLTSSECPEEEWDHTDGVFCLLGKGNMYIGNLGSPCLGWAQICKQGPEDLGY